MDRFSTFGCLIALIGIMIGALANDWFLATRITGLTAIVSILLAGILAGVTLREYPTKMKSDADSETERNSWAKNFLLIAIPNIIVSFVLIVFNVIIH